MRVYINLFYLNYYFFIIYLFNFHFIAHFIIVYCYLTVYACVNRKMAH